MRCKRTEKSVECTAFDTRGFPERHAPQISREDGTLYITAPGDLFSLAAVRFSHGFWGSSSRQNIRKTLAGSGSAHIYHRSGSLWKARRWSTSLISYLPEVPDGTPASSLWGELDLHQDGMRDSCQASRIRTVCENTQARTGKRRSSASTTCRRNSGPQSRRSSVGQLNTQLTRSIWRTSSKS